MNKRYWLRGLITGIIIYVIFLLIAYIYSTMSASGEEALRYVDMVVMIVALYFSPIIPLSLLLGWLYGKIKNRNKVELK